jgi:hypothetical protein
MYHISYHTISLNEPLMQSTMMYRISVRCYGYAAIIYGIVVLNSTRYIIVIQHSDCCCEFMNWLSASCDVPWHAFISAYTYGVVSATNESKQNFWQLAVSNSHLETSKRMQYLPLWIQDMLGLTSVAGGTWPILVASVQSLSRILVCFISNINSRFVFMSLIFALSASRCPS